MDLSPLCFEGIRTNHARACLSPRFDYSHFDLWRGLCETISRHQLRNPREQTKAKRWLKLLLLLTEKKSKRAAKQPFHDLHSASALLVRFFAIDDLQFHSACREAPPWLDRQMTKPFLIFACSFLFVLSLVIFSKAQQVVTLAGIGGISSFHVQTNQVITFVAADNGGSLGMRFGSGTNVGFPLTSLKLGSSYTGLTNVTLDQANFTGGIVSFSIATPLSQSVIPANTVVIPSDATGNVQIVLESSSDLVNWVSSQPGTYGNTYSNRFFRVRAIAQ
jgi:hypothetical protein